MKQSAEQFEAMINERYSCKCPKVSHHPQCEFYEHEICTCGLLFDLGACHHAQKLYPNFQEEWSTHLDALKRSPKK
jgi:hypothetical protein